MAGNNRIMIFGPKSDGTYVVEFKTAAGEALAISIPRTETAVIRHFQERMPMGSSCRMFRQEYLRRPWCFPDGGPPSALVRIPETPPDLPLECHTRAGFSLANQTA